MKRNYMTHLDTEHSNRYYLYNLDNTCACEISRIILTHGKLVE